MWRHLLNLFAAARRPLVVLDYETCGLGDEPPVEFATLVFAPWAPPEADPATLAARAMLGPIAADLTACVTTRLDPRRPIPAEATAIHKIGAAEVQGCPAWNDTEVVGYLRGLEAGDHTGDADLDKFSAVGPAVWCGHNVASFDLPRAQHWGHLSRVPDDVIDTDRLVRRLQTEHPHPLVVDDFPPLVVNGEVWKDGPRIGPPVVGHGLGPYRTTLGGCRLALLGEPDDDTAHGAVADCCVSARVLHACLELWAPLWPRHEGKAPDAALAEMLAALATPPLDCRTGLADLAWDGWLSLSHARERQGIRLVNRDAAVNLAAAGDPTELATRAVVGKGKYRGKRLIDAVRADRQYFERYLLGLASSPPVSGDPWCAEETRVVVSAALGLRAAQPIPRAT